MKKKILIVDDDPHAAAAVRRPLVQAGYLVATAASGDEALESTSYEVPDLILLDVVMPGPSGFEVCRRLRERPATQTTPVVFLTARNRVADLTEGHRAGSDLYLTKPVLETRLLSMVAMFLSETPLARKRSPRVATP